jgi:hypothetical protein
VAAVVQVPLQLLVKLVMEAVAVAVAPVLVAVAPVPVGKETTVEMPAVVVTKEAVVVVGQVPMVELHRVLHQIMQEPVAPDQLGLTVLLMPGVEAEVDIRFLVLCILGLQVAAQVAAAAVQTAT